jgi:hypothetical protein
MPRAATCVGCHAKDDVHKGLNGPACEQCHTAANWKKSTFDHDRQTAFPLRGAHAKTACAQCHQRPPREAKLGATCISCHHKDDPHAGQLGGDCASCHGDQNWAKPIRFDHGIASFPLVGKHAAVPCASCHKSRRYKDAPTACVDCHRADDPHRGAYRLDCASCHNPSDWANWDFDHGKTRFTLDGRHTDVACAACHLPGKMRPTQTCADCHQADDVHNGAFGPTCGQCHTTKGWEGAHASF